MRHAANALVAVVVLAYPDSGAQLPGRLLITALGLWAVYRLTTRSHSPLATAVDFAFTNAVCLAVPLLVDDPDFHLSNSAPIAVAGTAVISFTVALPVRLSFVMTVTIAASYATGAAEVIGWSHVPDVFNLYYFALQWGTCALIRLAELRVASAVDVARANRQRAEVTERVAAAVREYDREQLRLLHDTVASTLLLVGQGSRLAPDNLARQAARDLDVLGNPQPSSSGPVEVLSGLRELITHYRTAVRFSGTESLWVDAETGRCVVSVIREVLNNVDRHAHASSVSLHTAPHRVVITDDGQGFDPATVEPGYGLTHSMTGRMQTLGGSVEVTSSPGRGTSVTLTWPDHILETAPTTDVVDPDRLIDRTRTGYGLSLTAYAVLSLASMAPAAVHTTHPALQIILLSAAAGITFAAAAYTMGKRRSPALIPVALLAIALLQTTLLPSTDVGGQAQWSQAAIGWCIAPFLLRDPVRHAAVWLSAVWVVIAVYTFVRVPLAETAANLGLGTASILVVQLSALWFSGLIADAAAQAHAELTARTALMATERTTLAVQAEYRRRYADLLDRVRPLLEAWRDHRPVDMDMRRRARVESRCLRTLFSQSAPFDHPLLTHLRSAIDAAEEHGIDVSIDVHGALPQISEPDTYNIAAPLFEALNAAGSSARVTVLALPDVLITSIVCHNAAEASVSEFDAKVSDDVEVISVGGTLWVTVRHPPRGGEQPNDDGAPAAAAINLHHR